MGDHDTPATCLSSVEHGNYVRDVVLHYFGCVKVSDRAAYLNDLPPHKQERIKKEEDRIEKQRALFEAEDRTERKYLVTKLRKSLGLFFGRPEETRTASDTAPKFSKQNAWEMNAYALFFRNSEKYTDPICADQFPNQKLPVKDLLFNKDIGTNPLMRACADNEIRYFHLPGNNMDWVEASSMLMAFRIIL